MVGHTIEGVLRVYPPPVFGETKTDKVVDGTIWKVPLISWTQTDGQRGGWEEGRKRGERYFHFVLFEGEG